MTKTTIRTACAVASALAVSFAAHAAKEVPAAQQLAPDFGEATRLKPVASSVALQPYTAVAEVRVADLDLKAIEVEDEVARIQGEPPRYAIPMHVSVTPAGNGTWEDGLDADGRPVRVWRFRTGCDNAKNINLGFTRFRLPESATLFVYSPDLAHVVRGFTARDNNAAEQLWTPPVPGSEVVVELAVSPKDVDRVVLELGSVNPGYRTFGKDVGGGESALSGSCNVDVVCPEGDAWRDEIAAVAVISTGGSRFCTGFMVNNVRQDLTPYFMTANHCSVTASNAPSLVAFWNYENSTCRAPGSAQSGSAGNGSLSQFNTGATWLASYSPSDFTLVRLNAQPNAAWNVSYAGWDARPGDAAQSIGIHHPNTDEKRISFDTDAPQTTSYLGTTVPGDGTHVRIVAWNLGTTEGGSSGSPLFSQNHQVTGQLHGGYASCTSITSDYYGRVSVSWLGGGTSSTQLKTWLDPDNTGALQLNTLSTRGIGVSPSGNVTCQGPLGGPFTNSPFTYTLSNGTAAARGWTAQVTGGLGLLLNGSSAPIGGTLAAGASAQVVVTCGPAVSALPQGTYTGAVVITDSVSGVARTMNYSVEVGLTSISVGPSGGLETGGPLGGPFNGSAQYVVTSTSPSPVNVSVAANAPWITVDGGSSASFTLGSLGATRTVTVGIGAGAQSLGAGVYNGAVTFANDSGGTGGATRTVKLEVGRVVYGATGLPLAINDNSTVNSTIAVPEGFCIGDVDVDVSINHTYIGDLAIDLISPSGTTVRLHNRTGGTTDNIVARFDDDGGGRAPDGPGALSDLDLSSSAGTWTLRVADQATTDTGSLVAWSLRMVPQGSSCPTPVVFRSEPLDSNPGWAVQGQWAFGVPTGVGTGDPTSGNTGSNVYGYNLAGNYANSMPVYHLVSTPFDCRGFTGTRVAFFRKLAIESATYDKASFSVSVDGKTWTTVWNHAGATLNDPAWTRVSYDISAIADGQQFVYLRWTIGPTDSSVAYGGWNIDDISFGGFATQAPCPGDISGDRNVDGADLGTMLAAWGACPSGCASDLNQDGRVDGADLGAMLSYWGPCPN